MTACNFWLTFTLLVSGRRHQSSPRPVRTGTSALLLLQLACLATVSTLSAHPLGTFSINQFSRLLVLPDKAALHYIVDMAEIPTLQERGRIDRDQDGEVSDLEQQAYLERRSAELQQGFQFLVNGIRAESSVSAMDLVLIEGQGALPTMRITLALDVALPGLTEGQLLQIEYRNSNFSERLGWQEVIARGAEGVVLTSSDVPEKDISNGLEAYPQERLADPLTVRTATLTAALHTAVEQADSATGQPVLEQGKKAVSRDDEFTRLIRSQELTTGIVLTGLAMAFMLGAFHALSPGHGKSIVAAYLVGSRGTPRHAVFLGATVTLTHTIGVFALGLVTLFASQYILPEQLYPWLSVLSGLIVLLIGAVMLVSRLRAIAGKGSHHHGHEHSHDHSHDHDHDHDHAHHHGHGHLPPGDSSKGVTWKSLLALGISGGILPCPSALVVLLSAISLHRVGFGLVLIFAFSLGLASVLTTIGLLFVKARQLADRIPTAGPVIRVLPAVSALVIMILGAAITFTAWQQAF